MTSLNSINYIITKENITYNDSNAYPRIKQMLKIYMIINNPNCKHKSRKIKGGDASIRTSMVLTSGPKCMS